VAHLEFGSATRSTIEDSSIETESSAEDTATETDASGNYRETEAETVAVPFPVTKSNGVEKRMRTRKQRKRVSSDDSQMRPRRKREPASKRKRVTFRAAATDQAENRTQAAAEQLEAPDNTRRSRKNGETRC
jgi:hypothetical protein